MDGYAPDQLKVKPFSFNECTVNVVTKEITAPSTLSQARSPQPENIQSAESLQPLVNRNTPLLSLRTDMLVLPQATLAESNTVHLVTEQTTGSNDNLTEKDFEINSIALEGKTNTFALSPYEYADTVKLIWPVAVTDWKQNNTYKKLFTKVRRTALPNYLAAREPVPSALHIQAWRRLLNKYPDTCLVDYLEFGWPLDFTAPRPPVPTYVNHETNENFLTHIDNFLEQEIGHKALLGPFSQPPFSPWVQLSPLMTRPKKQSEK